MHKAHACQIVCFKTKSMCNVPNIAGQLGHCFACKVKCKIDHFVITINTTTIILLFCKISNELASCQFYVVIGHYITCEASSLLFLFLYIGDNQAQLS